MTSPLDAALHLARQRDGGWQLRSTRAEWAAAMLRGRPAEHAPRLLPGLYALCGGAHRLAARHALGAAHGLAPVETGLADAQALRLDTLREHLRRLWLDAPRLVASDGAHALAAPAGTELARAPFMHTGSDLGEAATARAARRWVETHVLQGDAEAWLAAWDADSAERGAPAAHAAHAARNVRAAHAAQAAHAAHWAATSNTWPARWLQAMRALLGERAAPCRALHAAASPAALRALAEALRTLPGFALAPTALGRPAETGCWTRLAEPAWRLERTRSAAAQPQPMPLWLRHAARVAEIARLVTAQGASWLAQGAFAPLAPRAPLTVLGPCTPCTPPLPVPAAAAPVREGLGWCEMARGLLVHWVRLDARERIADYRVLAPTEWNFHPTGAAARALADAAAADDAAVQAVAAAYDPCLELRVDSRAPECNDA